MSQFMLMCFHVIIYPSSPLLFESFMKQSVWIFFWYIHIFLLSFPSYFVWHCSCSTCTHSTVNIKYSTNILYIFIWSFRWSQTQEFRSASTLSLALLWILKSLILFKLNKLNVWSCIRLHLAKKHTAWWSLPICCKVNVWGLLRKKNSQPRAFESVYTALCSSHLHCSWGKIFIDFKFPKFFFFFCLFFVKRSLVAGHTCTRV